MLVRARSHDPGSEAIAKAKMLAASLLPYLLSPYTDPDRKKSAQGDSMFALDGVRGLAVMIVIASHTGAFKMRGQGSLGVLLFFVLSGFVLTLPFVDYPKRILHLTSLWRFFLNRALRILPILVVAVLYIRWLISESWVWVFDNLSFRVGWNHLWSVAEEVRFYLLFPLVVTALALLPFRFLRIVALAVLVWLAWKFQRLYMIDMMTAGFAEFFFWFFLAGMLSCLLYKSFAGSVASNRIARALSGSAALAILLFIFASSDEMLAEVWRPIFQNLPADFSLNGWNRPELWCGLFVVLLVSVTVIQDSLASRWMQSWLMRHLGLLSYSLYLFHVPVAIVLEPYKLQHAGLFVATFAVTYVIAIVSYIAVEKPFLMLKSA